LKRATGVAVATGKGIAYLMIFAGIAGIFMGAFNLIWFAFIGWFLLRAAEAEYQEVVYHEVLRGIKVGRIMTRNPVTIDIDTTVEAAVRDYFIKNNWVAYPVVKNEQAKGMVTLENIRQLSRKNWSNASVGDVMHPVSAEIVTEPDIEVFNMIPKLATMSEGRLLVVKDGRLEGIITRVDVNRAIVRQLHPDEESRPAA
jgi:CBS domain-containing protein